MHRITPIKDLTPQSIILFIDYFKSFVTPHHRFHQDHLLLENQVI
jgi:hypothetical protein